MMLKKSFFQSTLLLIFLSASHLSITQAQSCLTFDGVNDQVTIPAAVGQSLGNNDFTFEAWITGNESDITHGVILSNRTSINSGFQFGIHDYWGGSDHKMLMLRYNGVNWLIVNNGTYNAKILDGTCHHVAVTRAGTVLSFYVDGNLIGTKNVAADINLTTNNPIRIGSDAVSNSNFNGKINDVRIWKSARTEAEIQDGIMNGINPNTGNLLGFWELNDGSGQTIADLTNQNNGVLGTTTSNENSDPTWSADCCNYVPTATGDCLTFDGVNDQVTIPAAVGQSLGNNNFTFEAWVTGKESDIIHGTILSNRSGFDTGFHLSFHDYWGGSDHKMLMLRYAGINWLIVNNGTYNAKILDGTCHHIAVTRDGTTLSFYVDGNLIGTKTVTADLDLDSGSPILIGRDEVSSSPFKGNISDVRIWSIARKGNDIKDGIDNGVDPNANGLLGFWEMREGSGQTIADLTNQNEAVLGSQSSAETSDPTWGNACCETGIFTSVKDLLINISVDQLTVYPNPGTGFFNISFTNAFQKDKYTFSVYDLLGRTIKQGVLSEPGIDLEGYPSGQYWLKVEEEGSVRLGKISLMK